MLLIRLLLFFSFSTTTFAKLPEFITKQSLDNIRFITKDGKFTFYQRKSGSLNLSTNFSSEEVLEGTPQTEHKMKLENNIFLVEVIDSFLRSNNLYQTNSIYWSSYTQNKFVKLGNGVNPIAHSSQLISYVVPEEKTIYVKNLTNNNEYKIKYNGFKKSYFIPNRIILNNEIIIYNDFNTEGEQGLFEASLLTKEVKNIYKTPSIGSNLEICHQDSNLYLGEFPFYNIDNGSKIYKIPLYNNKNYEKKEIIYTSSLQDLGSLICLDNKIFFIKTLKFNKNLNLRESEVSSIDLKENKIKILTNEKRIISIIEMDGRVLTPINQKYFLVYGELNKEETLGVDKK